MAKYDETVVPMRETLAQLGTFLDGYTNFIEIELPPVRPHKHVRRANRDAELRRAMPVFCGLAAEMARQSGDMARLKFSFVEEDEEDTETETDN